MDNYIRNYDNLETKIVYNFKLGDGGIGDNIKFFMYVLHKCMKHNIKLYYLINNIQIEKFLKLKYEKMYIKKENIQNFININEDDIPNIMNSDIYHIVTPFVFYKNFSYDSITMPIQEVFQFSHEIKLNSYKLLKNDIDNYISIHLRLGDKFLETDKSYVLCRDDTREFDEKKLFHFIETCGYKNILFFCDNRSYKLKIKNKYNNIIITDCDIGHTSLSNTNEKQVLDTITEFYLMTNSEKIFTASYSGFSIVSSKFKNISIEKI
jgi:hypothetical protein